MKKSKSKSKATPTPAGDRPDERMNDWMDEWNHEVPEDLPDGIFFTAELGALRHSKAAAAIALLNVEKSHWKGPNGEVRVRNWVADDSDPGAEPLSNPADCMKIRAKIPENPLE